jgi:hypothetical protein
VQRIQAVDIGTSINEFFSSFYRSLSPDRFFITIENRFEDIQEELSRKYEDFRFKMRSNYEHIAVQGYCEKCKCQQNFALHYSELTKFSRTNTDIRVNCDICKAKATPI